METVYYSCESNSDIIETQTKQTSHLNLVVFRSEVASILDFIAKNYDFAFSMGKDMKSGVFFLCERRKKGMYTLLKEKKISIYQYKYRDFDKVDTCWIDRVNITESCDVDKEVVINDLYDYLMELQLKGLLIISFFPNRINGIPEDDQDLVDRAVLKYRMYGETIVDTIRQVHPQLLDRVLQGIKSEAFKEYGI
jgi:hypothetical protein